MLERVLVTEADFRTSLSVIRSLAKRGIDVTAVGQSNIGGLRSKYANKKFLFQGSEIDPDYIVKIAIQENVSVIFPHLEKTYLDLFDCLKEKGVNHRFLIIAPSEELVNFLTDKSKVIEKLRHFIPLPYTYCLDVDQIGLEAIIQFSSELLRDFNKIILKTSSEINKPYGPLNRYIVISKNNKSLLDTMLFRNFVLSNKRLLMQNYIDGYGVGIGGVWHNGKPVCIGGHRRLKESHLTGGISVLAESCIHEDAYKIALKIMDELKYTGIGMVEFKVSYEENKAYFMEINPRIWGTIPLYIYSGADIPYASYLLYRYGDTKFDYKFLEGKRMLFFKDYISSIFSNFNDTGLRKSLHETLNLLKLFFTVKEGILDLYDPMPFIYDIMELNVRIAKRLKRNVFG